MYILQGQTRDDNDQDPPRHSSLLCCDRYNLKEGIYYESVHVLPNHVDSDDKVVTDAKESFAIIARISSGTILTFTETEGFKRAQNITYWIDAKNTESTVLLKIK